MVRQKMTFFSNSVTALSLSTIMKVRALLRMFKFDIAMKLLKRNCLFFYKDKVRFLVFSFWLLFTKCPHFNVLILILSGIPYSFFYFLNLTVSLENRHFHQMRKL
jgi:hypothetical protein